ncbi:hypothetical protein N7509_010041 [Penicillium cosmopolitanum]|uniref:Uncharacterized protein n=1 Tax=Penicillium cosmopolitanum TaxID=1131564 RepID=A0A9X0B484_9EURO|nr:uncharacterized protein N7509_010041 [Penicillium cosmopolitanum]KAJ5387500.1 hypothetical protein N7509_010041 [Penicillium cosmopolitanum]
MHRAFGRFTSQFLRPVSFSPKSSLGSPFISRWNSTMTAVNGANGSDSRPCSSSILTIVFTLNVQFSSGIFELRGYTDNYF